MLAAMWQYVHLQRYFFAWCFCVSLRARILTAAEEDVLTGIEDLWNRYDDIFPHGNRNAASHRWASHVLERSQSMSNVTLRNLFSGFCVISGSPVQPGESKRWHLTLPKVGGGSVSGNLHFCCWPCVCDTQDYIKVDTKTVATVEGHQQYYFAVIGNPCVHPEKLPEEAPDVNCESGHLVKATLSDHGHVILGMFFETGVPGHSTESVPFMDSAVVDHQCKSRASSGYNSGMGEIFRQVAAINPIDKILPKSSCSGIISQSEQDTITHKISEEPVVIFGIDGMRCTEAAEQALEARGVCMSKSFFNSNSAIWSWFQCLYPDERVGQTKMHSYVFIGGRFVGNGFRLLLDSSDTRCTDGGPAAEACLSAEALDERLRMANAQRTCQKDCSGILPADGVAKLEKDIVSSSLVLYGWAGCPCTGLARSRFQERGVCYIENVWSSPDSLTMNYLQCRYGHEHHSFVWAGGEFVGNGFIFDPKRMSSGQYTDLLSKAKAEVGMCQTQGDLNLLREPLQSCTQEGDGTTTGWTRTGSCVWDPMDSGYHQVCVSMSQKFLEASRDHDGNDLSSVVSEGGHWCICAWAWASAVSRDPENMEGITIDCQRTNGKLRQVYELHIQEGTSLRSPSGAYYKARDALEALNKKCPPAENMTHRTSFATAASDFAATASSQVMPVQPSTQALTKDVAASHSVASNAGDSHKATAARLVLLACSILATILLVWTWSKSVRRYVVFAWSKIVRKSQLGRSVPHMKLGKECETESDSELRAAGA
mmetsp:Transcript_101504/g.186123  ORF Transcript_101504/g.186123 Transcript_101504/m.186123 type:complete len:767 (-) Transcript_101504:20-2320(-)